MHFTHIRRPATWEPAPDFAGSVGFFRFFQDSAGFCGILQVFTGFCGICRFLKVFEGFCKILKVWFGILQADCKFLPFPRLHGAFKEKMLSDAI